MAQECNSKVHSIYDVCKTCVENESGLVNSSAGKFGFVGDALSKCQYVDIPYCLVLQCVRESLKLVDEPGCPLSAGQEPKRPCLRRTAENDMDMTLGEV